MSAQEIISETIMGVRMEKELKSDIKKCAKSQHRTTSNWVRIVLEEAVEKQLAKGKA